MDRRQLTAVKPEEREPVFDQIQDVLLDLRQSKTLIEIVRHLLADGDLTSRSEVTLRNNLSSISNGRYRKGPPTNAYFFGKDLAEGILGALKEMVPAPANLALPVLTPPAPTREDMLHSFHLGIQRRLRDLTKWQPILDVARRFLAEDDLGEGAAQHLAAQFARVRQGEFGPDAYVFKEVRARKVYHHLVRMEVQCVESESERGRRAIREQVKGFPSNNPGLGSVLEWSAERIREWRISGVGPVELSRRLLKEGVRVHDTKLSRLSRDGPVRLDRPDTYLIGQDTAIALVTGLRKLGLPPTSQAAD